jgi:hypothetical protein
VMHVLKKEKNMVYERLEKHLNIQNVNFLFGFNLFYA